MIVSYKNRFLKVFLISLALLIIGFGGMIWITTSLYNLTNLDSDSVSSNFIISNFKLLSFLFALIMFIGQGLNIYSHYLLAKAKGYSAWLTLLGLINTFGIVILFLLPDRHKTS